MDVSNWRSWRFVLASALAIALALALLPLSSPSTAAAATGARVAAVGFAPSDEMVLVGTTDGRVLEYSIGSGRQAKLSKELGSHVGGAVTALAYSPSGDLAASAGRDSIIRIWDLRTGKAVRELSGHAQSALTLDFSGDGSQLISGGEDSRALLWDVAEGRLLHVFGGNSDFITASAFSPDGTSIATGTQDGRIRLWNPGDFAEQAALLGHGGRINDLSFSGDGTRLASAGADSKIKVWDVRAGSEAGGIRGHEGEATSVEIGSDGTVTSGGADGALTVSSLDSGSIIENTILASPITDLALDPPAERAVVGLDTAEFVIYDAKRGKELAHGLVGTKSSSDRAGAATGSRAASAGGTDSSFALMAEGGGVSPLAVGSGGPILLVTSAADNYSDYYAEILRTEGLNAFRTIEAGDLSAAALADHAVVILAGGVLSPEQTSDLNTWVNDGGNLIAMRPSTGLSGLFGLTALGTTLSEGYLKIDTRTSPGNGIVDETLQFHGTADRYALAGARAVATLYSDPTTATTSPAVTLMDVGTQGGQTAAFTYDLARSVVGMRQGNIAWDGQERDGYWPRRSDDLFYGPASFDPQDDWVDLTKVEIPQADEQQRLLANMILDMASDRMPLPRFWYLPSGHKAAVIMTGDDHGNGGTAPRFDQYLEASPDGCSVADWECIRGTSYIYTNTPISNAEAASYVEQGFEIGSHISTGCQDYTAASLAETYTSELADFQAKYTSLPAQVSNRTHCIAWSDWASQAEVSESNGIRMDTNYYYWPAGWVANRPGFFTGSGFPMRFTGTTGAIVDVYQAATQLTDESGQAYPYTIDTLLDRALGAEGYYGAFTVNAHTDVARIIESDSVVASAQERGVPVITSKQMLDWVDGRNASTMDNITWDGGQLSFSVSAAAGARNLQTMVPLRASGGTLQSVTRDGAAISFTTEVVKGVEYAFLASTSGTYAATYSADESAPNIASVSPLDGAVDVPQSTAVSVTFSEAMDAGTIDGSTFELRDVAGDLVTASTQYEAATQTARLIPAQSLQPGATYTATILGGSTGPVVRDTAGNALGATKTWSFTTADGPACPCSVWPDSASPGTPAASDPNAVELGMRFQSDVDGFVSGVRFWKSAQNTGTHTGNLWTADGQLLARAVFAGESASGWQEVGFDQPVALTANTTYVVSYHTTSGYYSADAGTFATGGVDAAPLRALRDGEDGPNGVYRYGATSGFPSQTWQSTNYWVDVVFDDDVPVDETPPAVVSTTPSDGATGVVLGSAVSAVFDENLDPASVTADSVGLVGPGGAAVPAAVSYDAGARQVTLQPDSPLASETSYTARFNGATAPAITDAAGNAMAADLTISFTTGGPLACPCSVWPDSASPGTPVVNDPNAVELGMRFQSDVDGFVSGVRFWKGAQNTGTHTGNLWTADGQLLARAVFGGESASGWQEVGFDQPVAVTANTTYVVSYHTTSGNYSADGSYFATRDVEAAPLRALRDGEDGPNGVYRYGATSGFPSQTWQSTNYWVDVVFNTEVPVDETPPAVVSTTPSDGATGVALGSAVSAVFDENLDPASVTADSVGLVGPGGAAVPAAVSYDAGARQVTVQPDSPLALDTSYTARFNGATAPAITDAAGNAMAADVTISFTTTATAEPLTIFGDAAPPGTPDKDPQASRQGIELGVKLVVDEPGSITGVRFYKDSASIGTHVGNLWSMGGELLASATFTNETDSGWQQVAFDAPVAVEPGVTYIASYHAPSGGYYGTDDYFTGTGAGDGPIRALADGQDGGNGVYAYGATQLPTDTWKGSNYWVDATFTPDTP